MGPLAGVKVVEFAGIGPGPAFQRHAIEGSAPRMPSGVAALRSWLSAERVEHWRCLLQEERSVA